jgi:hypothetical protein
MVTSPATILLKVIHMYRFAITFLAVPLMAASAAAQDGTDSAASQALAAEEAAPATMTVKGMLPGDSKLTCEQLRAEGDFRMKELDILQKAMEDIEVNPSAKTQALSVAMQGIGALASALPMPVARLVGTAGMTAYLDSASEDLKKVYAPLDKQFDFAMDRMDLMYSLYERKCLKGKK